MHALCTELEIVHVVDPFGNRTTTPELTYWRLHGLGDHRRPYTDDELQRLLTMIDPSARTAYVMFNEIPRIGDSRRFLALLDRRAARMSDVSEPGGKRRDRARTHGA